MSYRVINISKRSYDHLIILIGLLWGGGLLKWRSQLQAMVLPYIGMVTDSTSHTVKTDLKQIESSEKMRLLLLL